MKKSVISLFLIFALALSLCACAPKEKTPVQGVTVPDGYGISFAEMQKQADSQKTAHDPDPETKPEDLPENEPDDTASADPADAYLGEYFDEDVEEKALQIERLPDGSFSVYLSIFRLTTLDDGIGTPEEDGLHFTATDAAGNPISGVITLDGDTATVTFTDSTWSLIKNDTAFVYHRAKE